MGGYQDDQAGDLFHPQLSTVGQLKRLDDGSRGSLGLILHCEIWEGRDYQRRPSWGCGSCIQSRRIGSQAVNARTREMMQRLEGLQWFGNVGQPPDPDVVTVQTWRQAVDSSASDV